MIAVLGPGGVGGFIAGALANANVPVTLVARDETAEVLQRGGLTVWSVRVGDFTAEPAIATRVEQPVDTLIVATKAVGLEAALDRVEAEPSLVVPLLNGLDHMAVLRERYRCVAAGSIRIESDRPEPGVIVQTSPFLRVDLASPNPNIRESLDELARCLERAEIPTEVSESEPDVLWGKLIRLNALACTTSAWDVPLGAIRDDPERRAKLEACVDEAAAVARADGADPSAEKVMGELGAAHAGLRTSMQRDIAAGREPELDAIPGAVMRAGRRHGIPTPTIDELAARIAERAGIDPPAV